MKKTNKAVLTYTSKNKKVQNIGDYIQSIAAAQFIGSDFNLVNRESLNTYSGPNLKIIMNGWFMHHPENWPPSDNIEPLFISFHISPKIKNRILTDAGILYLKKFEPIGCRDLQTKKTLQNVGVNAYFSSCLTTTLGNSFKSQGHSQTLCFVDPSYQQYSYKNPVRLFCSIIGLAKNYNTIKKIQKKKYPNQKYKGLVKASQFHREYKNMCSNSELVNAEYITHTPRLSDFKTEQDKFDYAKKLLKHYCKSRLIITSRIHAALPCLAIGTPVIFVDNESFHSNTNPERGRFDGLLDLMNTVMYRNGRFQGTHNINSSFFTLDEALKTKNPHLYKEYLPELNKISSLFFKD